MDILFEICENYNPGFLVDSFSNNTEFFDKIKEKEKEGKEKIKKENLKKNQDIKKQKSFLTDSLTNAFFL